MTDLKNHELCKVFCKRMKIKYIATLCSILLVGYFGYTIQTQRGAYVFIDEKEFLASSSVAPEPEVMEATAVLDTIDYRKDVSEFVRNYSQFFEQQFDSLKSIGGAMTIVYKGQTVFCKPYGVKKQWTHDSVNVHTKFRLASVSKGFAGVLAVKMASREAIDLDEPIITYLPTLHLSKAYNQGHVTLRHVLSHTSGLLGYSFDPAVESGYTYHQLYDILYKAKIDALPGERYAYQNVIFSLLDTVLQIRTGMTYGDLMTEQIFRPLHMTDASVGFNGFVAGKNYAYPHKMLSAKTLTYKVCELNERYYCTAPAAGVNASISDLAIWLRTIMGYSKYCITKEMIQEIGTPYIHIPQTTAKYWDNNLESKDYGLGWRVYTYDGEKILYHGGFVQGYRAEVIVWPEKEIAMAMLLNSPNILAQKAVPYFIRMYSEYLNQKIN